MKITTLTLAIVDPPYGINDWFRKWQEMLTNKKDITKNSGTYKQ